MKHLSLYLCALCLIISCSSLPKVFPPDGSAMPEPQQDCRHVFPNGKWQFLHAIEATVPGGEKRLVMGVTVISSNDRTTQCVIMTIEGLVVFDARYDQGLVINRGVPPFDSEDFARGLINDIRLMFFMPDGPLIESGILKDESSVCRHQNPDGQIVDVITHTDKSWELRQYSKQFRLTRKVNAFFGKRAGHSDQPGIPDRLELTAHGFPGYALAMDLVEAVPLGQ